MLCAGAWCQENSKSGSAYRDTHELAGYSDRRDTQGLAPFGFERKNETKRCGGNNRGRSEEERIFPDYLRSTIPSFGLKVTWLTTAPSLTAISWVPASRRSPDSTVTVRLRIVGLTSTTPF
jgi:hypothetical protein